MPDKVALKRLTASDLTFFEQLFRTLQAGNQKAINLNADIFIEKFYPSLPQLVPTVGDRITLSLTIIGPAGAGPYVITRAITKREAYKNWRLNGEFIYDPDGQAGRFDQLGAGDLAVLEFIGDPVPQKVTLLLLSASSPADASLHAGLIALVPGGRRTMIDISRDQLATATASAPAGHPVRALAKDPELDAALEDAALGGTEGVVKLGKTSTWHVTAAALAAAKAAAEKNGRDGEALAWINLKRMEAAGEATDIQWVSETNAVSPFDFSAEIDGNKRMIDAKSTNGEFDRPVHMSMAEITFAAKSTHYDIWRIYKLGEDGARLKIGHDIGPIAKSILDGLSMPPGVTVDSVSIDPATLQWSEEITINRPEEDEDET